jgi:hypothetical protein
MGLTTLEQPASEDESAPPTPPTNEPPELLLASEGVTAKGALQLTPNTEVEADRKHASLTVSSTNFTAEDLAAQESADEAPTAAPAAPMRMSKEEAVGRLLFMSWNAGGGARKLPAVLDDVGYHIIAIQEAHADQMHQMTRHNWVLRQDQCIAARKPNRVETIGHGQIPGKVWWHVAEILFERPRLGHNTRDHEPPLEQRPCQEARGAAADLAAGHRCCRPGMSRRKPARPGHRVRRH